jgi:hypothetical protein
MQYLSTSWRSPVDSHTRSSPGCTPFRSHGLMRRLRIAHAYAWPEWNALLFVQAIAKFLGLAATVCFVSVAGASAAPATCQASDRLTKDAKALCVRTASLLLPQPHLTPVQIANGPDFDPVHPDRSRFAYFTGADNISCYFRPHYAFDRVKSYSLKFQCWQMTPDGAFFSRDGERIAVQQPKVVIASNNDGRKSASLIAGGSAATHEVTADRVKIKYLSTASPNQDNRYNEVFTEVAADRIMWLLGFPFDRVYPVGSVSCIGCGRDPFRNHLSTNKAPLNDSPMVFRVASASRGAPWERIAAEGDATWSWSQVNRFYADGEWTHQQQVEFDAYRLALGLFHFFDGPDKQNRLVCADWPADAASHSSVCAHPLIFVHDLGSTFGSEKGMNFMSANPRGRFSAWKGQTVFRDLQTCELSVPLGGDKRVFKEAQDLMVQRFKVLDATTVRSIFAVARFQIMDREQLQRLRHEGSTNVEGAALDEWTRAFLDRIQEIRNARNCRVS